MAALKDFTPANILIATGMPGSVSIALSSTWEGYWASVLGATALQFVVRLLTVHLAVVHGVFGPSDVIAKVRKWRSDRDAVVEFVAPTPADVEAPGSAEEEDSQDPVAACVSPSPASRKSHGGV